MSVCKTIAVSLITLLGIPVAMATDFSDRQEWIFGSEIDAVPYFFDGYYLSFIAGVDHWRARYVRTELTTPDFVTQKHFDHNQLNVNAVIVDYAFKDNFTAWWLGVGYEFWRGEITESGSNQTGKYSTGMLTVGGGYNHPLTRHFYLNPWAAVHVPVHGDREINFPDNRFEQRVSIEASIKLGIRF